MPSKRRLTLSQKDGFWLLGFSLFWVPNAGAQQSVSAHDAELHSAEVTAPLGEEEGEVAGAPEEREVEVRGRPLRRAADPTGFSSVLDRSELHVPEMDAARALARVPGVQTTRSGGGAELATLSLRGADAAQIPVYVAGVRVQDEVTGIADLSLLPLWMLDRVEVYRGVPPLFVSRGGMGGAVVFEPRLPKQNEGRGGLSAGSWGRRSAWVSGAVSSGESDSPALRASTSLSYRYSQSTNNFSYRDDGGTAWNQADDSIQRRQNADFSSHDVWSLSRLEIPTRTQPVRVDVVLHGLDREQGVTGLSTIQALHSRAHTRRALAGASLSLPCSLFLGAEAEDAEELCELKLSQRLVVDRRLTQDPWGELALGAPWLALRSERAETRAELQWTLAPDWRAGLHVGAEWASLALDEPQLARTRAAESFLQGGAWLGPSWKALSLLAHTRFSCLQVNGREETTSRQQDSCFFEARLGARVPVGPDWAFRMNVSRATRAPTLGERYGISASTQGNPALQEERGWTGDAGWTGQGQWGRALQWELEASVFSRWADQLIAYRRSSLGVMRPYNVASARYLGGEWSVGADWEQLLRWKGSVALLDPRDTSAERRIQNSLIPYLSRWTVNSEWELYHVFQEGVLNRLGLTTHLSYRGARVADPAGLLIIPEQWLVDVLVSVLFLDRSWSLQARVENLFNQSQFDLAGYPLPGRGFAAQLEATF